MNVSLPKVGPFEINLNTIVVLIGFAAGFVAWGYTLAELETGRTSNATDIDRIDKRLTSVETLVRRLDQHELRINNVEKSASDASSAMRAVEATLSLLTADVRVVKEILTRIEATQNRQGLSR